MQLLRCEQVAKYFKVRNEVVAPLKDISFSMERGEIRVIHGKSGVGKSVLISLLAGLDNVSFGSIQYLDKSYADLSLAALTELRRSQIGIIFQNHNLISSWTVLENTESALIDNPDAKERRAKAVRILGQLGLDHRLHHLPHQLSMGEQQRSAIARALIRNPRLILADEPTGDVDPETAEEIMHLLYGAVDHSGAALLITTHGHFPHHRADNIMKLENGLLIPSDLRTGPDRISRYIQNNN